jgi:hypothetical protein
MSTELDEHGDATLTRLTGFCDRCGNRGKRQPAHEPRVVFQLTSTTGYVTLCRECLRALEYIAAESS